MRQKKTRIDIPIDVAARVLFFADRICCVCRVAGKPVQIHHIDENPSNNVHSNLAVLCLDCHNETQLRGGFGRRLDSEQIILYRDDWNRIVARGRAVEIMEDRQSRPKAVHSIELATSVAEAYRENEEYSLLAVHYHALGNYELRDKYIEIALENEPIDQTICYLRALQDRPELIPQDVSEREINRLTNHGDWLQRARLYVELGRTREAVHDYVKGVGHSLDEGRTFSAAFYLRELFNRGLVEQLFVLALREAEAEGDLWWQVRALEELGWQQELDNLILRNADAIEHEGKLPLRIHLARIRGDKKKELELSKQFLRGMRQAVMTKEGPRPLKEFLKKKTEMD